MTAPNTGSVGGFAAPTGICTPTTKNQIITQVNLLRDLFEDNYDTAGFDEIAPALRARILVEIDELLSKIDATPSA